MKVGIEIPSEQIAGFCQRWKITEFGLFGSVLREDFGPESDVDVLVTFAPEAHPDIPWLQVIGMRNRLVHEYFRINPAAVWDTVKRDLYELIKKIEPLVPREDQL